MKHYLLTFVVLALAIGGVIYFAPKDVVVEGTRVTSQAPVSPQFDSQGGILPDPVKTPGALNTDVTQDTISKTICVSGWTATIRPPSTFTTLLKLKQLKGGYNVNGDTKPSDYELDHLWSLENAGNPTSEQNLWPELNHINYQGYDLGAKTKDRLENVIHKKICNGTLTIAQAQQALLDWPTAYKKYIGDWPKYGTQPALGSTIQINTEDQ